MPAAGSCCVKPSAGRFIFAGYSLSVLTVHEKYMYRCLELAQRGAGYTAPNPMVGAVLVHKNRIIGEGYHHVYGEAHAEVNCIDSVKEEDKGLLSESTLYVSLEPCAHFGKTPPCADLVIQSKVPECIIACRDPFNEVNGKGIEKLINAGIKVQTNILEAEARHLNRRFFTFHTKHRPYIMLKWAQTADGIIGTPLPDKNGKQQRLMISNEYSSRLVHQWRSEEASILVGTNTAIMDNPELTNRWWKGNSPVRLVVDMDLSLPRSLKIFNGDHPTIIFNTLRHDEKSNPAYYQVATDSELVHQVCNALYQLKIQSVMVEGGARLLQSFIDAGVWDEARVISNRELFAAGHEVKGLPAPELSAARKANEVNLLSDTIEYFVPLHENL